MYTLPEKLRVSAEAQNLTGSEVEYRSRLAGTRISSSLWYKIVSTGFSNISRPRLLLLSRICGLPLRFLADDLAETPLQAVQLEVSCLSEADKKALIRILQQEP
ncbi:MAG: hypothetical protein ACI85U_003952 [Candidatus Promineifilaceae bacterium]|jgi:hypothetical protein